MRIKQLPEEFVVKEINSKIRSSGNFSVYLLKKFNLDTQSALDKIEQQWKCKIGVSGFKDKHAMTEQFISTKERKPDFEISSERFSMSVAHVGYSSAPISLGSHESNYFEIKVHEVNKEKCEIKEFGFPNYFGEQRFSEHNLAISRALVKKEFSTAALLLSHDRTYGHRIRKHLKLHLNDSVGAIKHLPEKTFRLIFSSLQSYFFNKEVSLHVGKGKRFFIGGQDLFFQEDYDEKKFLLPGWDTEFSDEGITANDFIFRQFPEISLEGATRNGFVNATNVEWDGEWIKFSLPKGSYATIFLRTFFEEDIIY